MPKGWAPRVGIFAFIGVVLLSLLLPLPLPGWKFTVSALAIVRDFIEVESPANLTETHRELALRFDEYLVRNQTRLNVLYGSFATASALLAVEVGAWRLALTKGSTATTPRRRRVESAAATTQSRVVAEARPEAVSA